MPSVLVPPQALNPSARSVPCSMRCTGRPRPIPDDDSTRCMTRSTAGTCCSGSMASSSHPGPTGPGGLRSNTAVKGVGEPCAGEPHARFDGRGLETERGFASPRQSSTQPSSGAHGSGESSAGLLLGDLLSFERPSVPGLNALAYRIFEVLLQTGAVLGTDGCSPVMASLWQIHESGSSVARSRGSRVSRWGGPGLVGGIDVVVVARPHGGNVSVFSSRGALNIDRRRAGCWDREQLIGGKAIEPRK